MRCVPTGLLFVRFFFVGTRHDASVIVLVSVFADASCCVPTILIFNLLVAYYFLRLGKVAACFGTTKVDGLAEGIEGLGVLLQLHVGNATEVAHGGGGGESGELLQGFASTAGFVQGCGKVVGKGRMVGTCLHGFLQGSYVLFGIGQVAIGHLLQLGRAE